MRNVPTRLVGLAVAAALVTSAGVSPDTADALGRKNASVVTKPSAKSKVKPRVGRTAAYCPQIGLQTPKAKRHVCAL